jgi:hypothetical protein
LTSGAFGFSATNVSPRLSSLAYVTLWFELLPDAEAAALGDQSFGRHAEELGRPREQRVVGGGGRLAQLGGAVLQ